VGPAVLLVEDNEINQIVAVAVLRRRGYAVDVVENGREALDAVERKRYAAVLMDCQMPVMDGYAATAELRSRENGGTRVPVIALTAHAADGERERCLAAGMDDFLTKPVRPEALVAALDRAIGGHGVLDHDVLERLGAALDPATLDRVVEVFLDQAAAFVATICATQDDATLRRTAHALKGSAATVGATAVAEIADELERTGDRALDDRLAEAFARTRAQLAR
jgi:CheY-like chemotaxis protein/HPt (histidine-containing phosphotransfer) domain-containing protein